MSAITGDYFSSQGSYEEDGYVEYLLGNKPDPMPARPAQAVPITIESIQIPDLQAIITMQNLVQSLRSSNLDPCEIYFRVASYLQKHAKEALEQKDLERIHTLCSGTKGLDAEKLTELVVKAGAGYEMMRSIDELAIDTHKKPSLTMDLMADSLNVYGKSMNHLDLASAKRTPDQRDRARIDLDHSVIAQRKGLEFIERVAKPGTVLPDGTFQIAEGFCHGKGFQDHSVLGQGTFGVVNFSIGPNNRPFVRKIPKNEHYRALLVPEAEIQLRLSGLEGVIQAYGIDADGSLIMEFAGQGSLVDVISKEKDQGIDQRKEYLRQTAKVLVELKKRGVIHRDIKEENILVMGNGKIKIADFGLARRFPLAEKDYQQDAGTLGYMAPECLANKYGDYAMDAYSFGVMMFRIITLVDKGEREFPYPINEMEPPAYKYMMAMGKLKPELENIQDPLAVDLLEKLLKFDPKKRITIEEALKHPYFVQNGKEKA